VSVANAEALVVTFVDAADAIGRLVGTLGAGVTGASEEESVAAVAPEFAVPLDQAVGHGDVCSIAMMMSCADVTNIC
jgi:hypothetical protein